MIRTATIYTNVLQDRDDTIKIFGRTFHESATREGLYALVAVAAILITIALFQTARYHNVQMQQQSVVSEDIALGSRVSEAKSLANQLRELQSLVDTITLVRVSGNDFAIKIVHIGNNLRVDNHTWLTNLSPNPTGTGWELKGASRSLHDLGVGIHGVARSGDVSLETLSSSRTDVQQVVSYTASLATGAPAAATTAPAAARLVPAIPGGPK